MPAMELTDSNFEQQVIKSDKPVLVDFWAPWCGPCRMVAPVVDELAKDYAGKLTVAKLNSDENGEVLARYRVSAIPTLLFFKQGKVVDTMVGVHSKSEIVKRLDSVLTS